MIDKPAKIGPLDWVPLKDILSRWCNRYGSIEVARDKLQGLLRSAPSLLLEVDCNGEESRTVKRPEFWNDIDLSVQTDVNGADYLFVPYDAKPWVSNWQFFVRARDVEREESRDPAPADSPQASQTAPDRAVDTKTWVIREAIRLKKAGKIPRKIRITDFAEMLEEGMKEAKKTNKSLRLVTWRYIKNQLPRWGLWPVESIKTS